MFEKEIEFKNLLTESEHSKIKNDHFPEKNRCSWSITT